MALLVLPLVGAGCSAGNGPQDGPASAGPAGDGGWVVVTKGSPTPSAVPTPFGAPRPTASAPVTFPPRTPGCGRTWTPGQVLIPVTVRVGRGSLTVTWPRQGRSDYRVAAIPQPLVAGSQPEPAWRTVSASAACTVTTTIAGLRSGRPYVVWLDAPDTGRRRDGSRNLYSGRSGVVYPT